ncbi:hypothetical protein RUM44_003004 [Polyplax serrata]|uniref:F-box domain-containing protein n=1 Tax=Polyplax serrata TaxID=468196 RepID=A0ABR1AYS3_POLSC
MEKILELCDSYGTTYPQHFQVFIDNCIATHGENFGANDYLFAAVYFMVLETGFTPVDKAGTIGNSESATFDIRKLRRIIAYGEDDIRISNHMNNAKYLFYRVPLKLGGHGCSLCELQGVPSAEINTHLIINFLCKEPHIIKSLCLSTEAYVQINESQYKHKFVLKNLRELSILIKNNIAIHIKDTILTNDEEGCSGNLLCIPEEIQKKIIYSLKKDPISIQTLSSTCSYFYSFISKDTKLWEDICFQEYGGWILNKALQETSTVEDSNVFRTAFLNLKIKDSISQAVKVNDVIYLSGMIGLDVNTNKIVPGGVENEAKQIFKNMDAVLKAAGSGLDKIVKASVFLNDINDFGKVNEIYKQYITGHYPARSAYQVGKLPAGAIVEIEAIAVCGDVETKYIKQ